MIALLDTVIVGLLLLFSPFFSSTKNLCGLDNGLVCNFYFTLVAAAICFVNFLVNSLFMPNPIIKLIIIKMMVIGLIFVAISIL